MIVAGAIPILQEIGGEVGTIGLVDYSGELAPVQEVMVNEEEVDIEYFQRQEDARQAWQSGEIVGFALVPQDYLANPEIKYLSDQEPGAMQESVIAEIVRRGLVPNQTDAFYKRLDNPAAMEYTNITGRDQLSEGLELILKVAAPVALGLMFALAVLTGTSQIGQAVVEEKDQRSMEMVITSVSPEQLISGKLAGMTMLTLTQVGIWIGSAFLALALAFGQQFASGAVSIPWRAFLWAALLGIPGYFLFAILSAMTGVIAGDKQQAQQLAGMLGFVGLFPLWFMAPIVQSPSGPVAVGLTIFPLTSPVVGMFRLGISEVPAWQLLAGFLAMLLSISLGIWLVARIFRASMLMYGQRLRPGQIWQSLKQAG
jgi:ABC-2 type transport system permease protein